MIKKGKSTEILQRYELSSLGKGQGKRSFQRWEKIFFYVEKKPPVLIKKRKSTGSVPFLDLFVVQYILYKCRTPEHVRRVSTWHVQKNVHLYTNNTYSTDLYKIYVSDVNSRRSLFVEFFPNFLLRIPMNSMTSI
jgi:hypothetical protein